MKINIIVAFGIQRDLGFFSRTVADLAEDSGYDDEQLLDEVMEKLLALEH